MVLNYVEYLKICWCRDVTISIILPAVDAVVTLADECAKRLKNAPTCLDTSQTARAVG